MFFKKMIITLSLSFLVAPLALATEEYGPTREQVISINDAFVPSGFDSSSDAFVVVNGLFPNGCYRFKDARVDHIGPALHEVRTYALITEGLCLMVLVPFSKEVQLGKLQAGEHSLRFVNGDGTWWEKKMTVEE